MKNIAKRVAPPHLPTIAEIVAAIDIPVEDWPGNCYAIVMAIKQAGLIPGVKSRYGHWAGRVAPGTMFFGKAHPRHGWLICPNGTILDPTRWVFEGRAPYVAVVLPGSPHAKHYDVGGNALVREIYGTQPAPAATVPFGPAAKPVVCPLHISHAGAISFIWNIFQCEPTLLTEAQVYWLAHLAPADFGEPDEGKAIFQAIDKAKKKAWIPIDNWHAVVEEP